MKGLNAVSYVEDRVQFHINSLQLFPEKVYKKKQVFIDIVLGTKGQVLVRQKGLIWILKAAVHILLAEKQKITVFS